MADSIILIYVLVELFLALLICISNFLVIFIYFRTKNIRTPTNNYILSLAIADFCAGAIGIPLTIISKLTRWPNTYYACLGIHLILSMLCTISILHLMAMAIDKYMAICLERFDFQSTFSKCSIRWRRANYLIFCSWVLGTLIAGLPLFDGFGFASNTICNFQGECKFAVVVDNRFLVFVLFIGTILLPISIIAYCHLAMYVQIGQKGEQMKTLLGQAAMQRIQGARVKLLRLLLTLASTMAICWLPLHTMNAAKLFLPSKFNAGHKGILLAVLLSHFGFALIPLISAYGIPGFKRLLRRIFTIRKTSDSNSTNIRSTYICPRLHSPAEQSTPFIINNNALMKISDKKFHKNKMTSSSLQILEENMTINIISIRQC